VVTWGFSLYQLGTWVERSKWLESLLCSQLVVESHTAYFIRWWICCDQCHMAVFQGDDMVNKCRAQAGLLSMQVPKTNVKCELGLNFNQTT
jgi:hypothetical protein